MSDVSPFSTSPDPFRSAIEDVNTALAHQPDVAARIVGLLLDAAQVQADHAAMYEEWKASIRFTCRLIKRTLDLQEKQSALQIPQALRRPGRANVIPFATEARHA